MVTPPACFVANTFWGSASTERPVAGVHHYEDFYGTFGDAVHRTTLVREFGTVQEWFGARGHHRTEAGESRQ